MSENAEQNNNDTTTENPSSCQFLTFVVGEEEYGVELMTIREIKGWVAPTQLPNSPNFMKGVIDLRGVVIPIFDLRHRFDMGITEPTEKNVVIIIAVEEKLIGILVDAVSDILNSSTDQIKPAPQVDSKIDSNFINGLISSDDKMVVLLNIENLFDAETLANAEKASKNNPAKEADKKVKETNKEEETETEDKPEEEAKLEE